MNPTTCTIFPSDSVWSLAITTSDQSTFTNLPIVSDLAALVDSIIEATRDAHLKEFLLALPSNWCLSATLSSADLPRRDRHQALCYRLEEKVPLPAEDFTADFIIGPDQTLGVCIASARLAPLLAAFDARKLHVEFIIPAALLAAPAEHDNVVLLTSADELNLIQYEHNLPMRWYAFPNTPRDLALHLKVLSLSEDAVSEPHDLCPLAARRAYAILTHSQPAPLNLRRDNLASSRRTPQRRQFIALAASIAFFLIALNIALLYRANAYAAIARTQQSLQQSLFHDALPNQPIPIDIESRLASEERRVHLGDLPGNIATRSALLTLRDALTALPTDIRYRLTDISLTPTDFTLTGQSHTHADADALATTLRANPQFDIAPPHTEQSSDNLINFTITAKLTAATHP